MRCSSDTPPSRPTRGGQVKDDLLRPQGRPFRRQPLRPGGARCRCGLRRRRRSGGRGVGRRGLCRTDRDGRRRAGGLAGAGARASSQARHSAAGDRRQQRQDHDQGAGEPRAGRKYAVYATQGNLNNHIGVPLTLLAMTRDTELGVVEMGGERLRRNRPALCDRRAQFRPDYQRRAGAPRRIRGVSKGCGAARASCTTIWLPTAAVPSCGATTGRW